MVIILSCARGLKSFKNNSAAYDKNFRLRDKNHAPFKLNGQTVEVLRVGVMIVGVISVGVMIVGVISVGVMTVGVLSVGVMT